MGLRGRKAREQVGYSWYLEHGNFYFQFVSEQHLDRRPWSLRVLTEQMVLLMRQESSVQSLSFSTRKIRLKNGCLKEFRMRL